MILVVSTLTGLLPDGVHLRTPRAEDQAALLDLVRADERAAYGRTTITGAEVVEMLSPPVTTLADDQWLAVDADDAPLAWVVLWDHGDTVYQDVEGYRDPSRSDESLRALMLGTAVRRARHRASAAGVTEAFLVAGCHEGDEAWGSTLRSSGFGRRRVFHRMRMDLHDAASLPVEVPDGVDVVPFTGSHAEWAAMHAVMESAFSEHYGYAPTSPAAYRASTSADPSPDREMWRLAYVGHRVVGALVASGRNAEAGGGYVRELGVLPAYRGRGIASALLCDVLDGYRRLGRTWAGLGVDVHNTTGALGLYERVGLRTDEVLHAYERRLLPLTAS